MLRTFILGLTVIALGSSAADAGLIGFDNPIQQPSISSMQLFELALAGNDADDRPVVELGGRTFSWAVTRAQGRIAYPFALCGGLLARGRQRSIGRAVISNRLLPPSPLLEGLLKPA
jgi:hypothetical protein